MTITEFLLARIAKDEAVARNAAMRIDDDRRTEWVEAGSGVLDTGDDLWPIGDSRISRHAAHFDPARVLVECEAKRRAIDAAWSDHVRIEGEWGMSQSREAMDAKGDAPEVVVALASVYITHPDYRDEWRA